MLFAGIVFFAGCSSEYRPDNDRGPAGRFDLTSVTVAGITFGAGDFNFATTWGYYHLDFSGNNVYIHGTTLMLIAGNHSFNMNGELIEISWQGTASMFGEHYQFIFDEQTNTIYVAFTSPAGNVDFVFTGETGNQPSPHLLGDFNLISVSVTAGGNTITSIASDPGFSDIWAGYRLHFTANQVQVHGATLVLVSGPHSYTFTNGNLSVNMTDLLAAMYTFAYQNGNVILTFTLPGVSVTVFTFGTLPPPEFGASPFVQIVQVPRSTNYFFLRRGGRVVASTRK